jgi:uncharacterized protein
MRVEIRNNSVHLDGYVNVHTRDSRELPSPKGKFVEQIMPKAFSDSLQRRSSVDLLFNHRSDRKLGSIADGNLELFEDAIGLRAICTVTDDEVVNKAKSGDLKGWSFGFVATEQRWADGENGLQRRYVDSLDLIEVSILDCTPAYYATTIEARGDESVITEQRFEARDMTPVVTEVEERAVEDEVIAPDYTVVETQILIDKLKGGH